MYSPFHESSRLKPKISSCVHLLSGQDIIQRENTKGAGTMDVSEWTERLESIRNVAEISEMRHYAQENQEE